MRGIAGIALFLGTIVFTIGVGAAQAEQPPVRYQVPASWKLLKSDGSTSKRRSAVYEITEGVGPNDHPTVIIRAYEKSPGLRMDGINMAEVGRQIIPSGVLVSDADDGPNWRTCVFLGRIDDVKVVALYRIGIQDGYVAEEAFIFPVAMVKSEELALLTVHGQTEQQGRTTGVYAPFRSTYKTISIFNDLTKTLAINGPAPFEAKAIMAKPMAKPSTVYRAINPLSNSRSSGG